MKVINNHRVKEYQRSRVSDITDLDSRLICRVFETDEHYYELSKYLTEAIDEFYTMKRVEEKLQYGND